jgi:hypothetical protein
VGAYIDRFKYVIHIVWKEYLFQDAALINAHKCMVIVVVVV